MFILTLIYIFFSSCDFTQQCEENGCIYNDIPFGSSLQLVKEQVREINFHLTPVLDEKSNSISYEGLNFWKYNEVSSVTFRFNKINQLDGIFIYMEPNEVNAYPELFHLYVDIQKDIISSEKYDTIETKYEFKHPFDSTNISNALAGIFTQQELDALEQDGSQRMTVNRFGQVWSRFKSKNLPIEATVMISYVRYLQRTGGHFVVILSFEDISRSGLLNSGF